MLFVEIGRPVFGSDLWKNLGTSLHMAGNRLSEGTVEDGSGRAHLGCSTAKAQAHHIRGGKFMEWR